MLRGNDIRLGAWLYLAELSPDEITPHIEALVDLALSEGYEHEGSITKTALKGVRAAVAARTGEPKTTAELPSYVLGDGTTGNPYRISFPSWALELPPPPAVRVSIDYSSYTKAVLYEMAKARGLAVVTRMTKAEIIAALEASDKENN